MRGSAIGLLITVTCHGLRGQDGRGRTGASHNTGAHAGRRSCFSQAPPSLSPVERARGRCLARKARTPRGGRGGCRPGWRWSRSGRRSRAWRPWRGGLGGGGATGDGLSAMYGTPLVPPQACRRSVARRHNQKRTVLDLLGLALLEVRPLGQLERVKGAARIANLRGALRATAAASQHR